MIEPALLIDEQYIAISRGKNDISGVRMDDRSDKRKTCLGERAWLIISWRFGREPCSSIDSVPVLFYISCDIRRAHREIFLRLVETQVVERYRRYVNLQIIETLCRAKVL